MEQAQCTPYKFLHVLVVNRLVDFFSSGRETSYFPAAFFIFSSALQTGIIFNAIRVAVGFYLLFSVTFSRNQGIKEMFMNFFLIIDTSWQWFRDPYAEDWAEKGTGWIRSIIKALAQNYGQKSNKKGSLCLIKKDNK